MHESTCVHVYVMLTGKFMQVFRNFFQVILEKHVYIKPGFIVALYMTKNRKVYKPCITSVVETFSSQ